MSDLQIALIAVGLTVLVAVIAYNQWQERKLRKRADSALDGDHADALLEMPAVERRRTEADEVSDDPVVLSPAAGPPQPSAPVEHTLGLPPFEQVGGTGTHPELVLDPRLDFIATIVFPAAQSGEELLRLGREMLPGARRVHWEGRSVEDAWGPAAPGGQYVEARCGLQIVDRRGVATEREVLEFSKAVQSLAVTLSARSEFAGRAEALRQASALDALCADVDIQVGLTVVKPGSGAIPVEQVREFAERAGCTPGADGVLRLHAPGGGEIFALTVLDAEPARLADPDGMSARGVAVTLDVPRAPPTGEAFNQFAGFAHSLAEAVGGEVVDDEGRAIAQAAMVAIAQHVAGARLRMHEAGIQAGSALALRLFS